MQDEWNDFFTMFVANRKHICILSTCSSSPGFSALPSKHLVRLGMCEVMDGSAHVTKQSIYLFHNRPENSPGFQAVKKEAEGQKSKAGQKMERINGTSKRN